MMGITGKLNAPVIIRNLQNMHGKSPPPTGARRRMETHTGGRFDRLVPGVADVVEFTDGQ
jgi:hypothetical protein